MTILDAFQPKVFTDENGIKTIIEYRENEDGRKVKVIRDSWTLKWLQWSTNMHVKGYAKNSFKAGDRTRQQSCGTA